MGRAPRVSRLSVFLFLKSIVAEARQELLWGVSTVAMLAKGGSKLGYSNMSFLGPPGLAGPTDRMPHMPPAGLGYSAAHAEETAEKTLQPDIYEKPPPTPDYMKKWRKDYDPGKSCLHPGLAEDTDHERLPVYGRPEPGAAPRVMLASYSVVLLVLPHLCVLDCGCVGKLLWNWGRAGGFVVCMCLLKWVLMLV